MSGDRFFGAMVKNAPPPSRPCLKMRAGSGVVVGDHRTGDFIGIDDADNILGTGNA